jgi:hypothetical protein
MSSGPRAHHVLEDGSQWQSDGNSWRISDCRVRPGGSGVAGGMSQRHNGAHRPGHSYMTIISEETCRRLEYAMKV